MERKIRHTFNQKDKWTEIEERSHPRHWFLVKEKLRSRRPLGKAALPV